MFVLDLVTRSHLQTLCGDMVWNNLCDCILIEGDILGCTYFGEYRSSHSAEFWCTMQVT
jgi:hypothetical protein